MGDNLKLVILIGLIPLLLLPGVNALQLSAGDIIAPSQSNTRYIMSNDIILDNFRCYNNYIEFNDNLILIESNTSVTVHIVSYNEEDDIRLLINASYLTNFTIEGFGSGDRYTIYIDNVSYGTALANASGSINFSYEDWSIHYIKFEKTSEGGGGGGSENIICYCCRNGELLQILVKGLKCPDGWFLEPPDCSEEPEEKERGDFGDKVFFIGAIIFFSMLVITLSLRARGKKHGRKKKNK